MCDGFLAECRYKIVVGDLGRSALPIEIENSLFLGRTFWITHRTILMCDELKNVRQFRARLIN
jgi:hypothetical protein